MKLKFNPAVTAVKNIFIVCPKNRATEQKVVIKCNEVQAFMLENMAEEIDLDELAVLTTERFPDILPEEIEGHAAIIEDKILNTDFSGDELSVVTLC